MESPLDQAPIDTEALRRLHYAAAIACGVFATLVMHILLTVLGLGLDSALRSTDPRHQFISAIAWWAIAAAGFVGGWASAAYLIAAARERDLIYKLAQWFLIALVFVIATVGGISDVIAGLTALGLGVLCAFCGARLAYLNAEQV